MALSRTDKWINLSPALIASVIDITVTIVHQPQEYWNGDLSKANEGNPIGAFLMSEHIGGLFAISALWVTIVISLGYYLNTKYSRYFLLFTLIAHSYGAATWISPRYGFWSAMTLILFNTATYLFTEQRINPSKKDS